MADTITLRRTASGWVATFEGPQAKGVRELFGTDTLPTPFGKDTPQNTVLVAVRLRNEGLNVRIAGHDAICGGCADTNYAHN